MIFVSVHVPKTAGTTLAHVFDHASERRVLFDYAADYSNVMFDEAGLARFTAALPFVRHHFRFIHGHFYLDKYAGLIPEARLITCFRRPVDRVISQFRHIWYENNPDSPQVRRIEEGMSVVDFAQGDYNVANAHRKHLNDRDPGELDFVFINERLAEGLKLFGEMFPGVIRNQWALNVPRINDGDTRERQSKRPKLDITPAQIDALAPVLADETAYYERATARFDENLSKHG